MARRIGYARVSTGDQDLSLQRSSEGNAKPLALFGARRCVGLDFAVLAMAAQP